MTDCCHLDGWMYPSVDGTYRVCSDRLRHVPTDTAWCAACGEMRYKRQGKWVARKLTKQEADLVDEQTRGILEGF